MGRLVTLGTPPSDAAPNGAAGERARGYKDFALTELITPRQEPPKAAIAERQTPSAEPKFPSPNRWVFLGSPPIH